MTPTVARTIRDVTGIQISRPKRVLLAKPRGYCAGVDRAVVTVEEALRRHGAPIYVRKQIVHNSYVVRSLEQRGVVFVSEVDEVPTGARVVFSAHGVAPSVHAAATVRELKTLDATCPLVSKVHTEARRFAAAGYEILLVGHRDHEEVEGIVGEAPEHVQVVESPEEAAALHVSNPDRLVWLSQTTLSVDETLRIVDVLRERFPKLASPPSDDICYASQNRQTAIKSFAAECDLVLVVGSENSSNSKRLVEVALEAGAKAAYLVDHAAQVDETWLTGVQTLGVTSGASVPELLVQELLDWLSPHGFSRVDEVTVAQERLTFALPRELRTPA